MFGVFGIGRFADQGEPGVGEMLSGCIAPQNPSPLLLINGLPMNSARHPAPIHPRALNPINPISPRP